MGGRKKRTAGPPGTCAVWMPCGGRSVERGRAAVETIHKSPKAGSGFLDAVIARMVGVVIGRRVVLHDLLSPDDFAFIYAGKEGNRPLWRYRHVGGVPFHVALLSHDLQHTEVHPTIVSNGYLELARGREIPVLMEVCVDRNGISELGAVMQVDKRKEPLVLNFDLGPVSFQETAFSFDICGEGLYGLSGCGFIAFSDWNG